MPHRAHILFIEGNDEDYHHISSCLEAAAGDVFRFTRVSRLGDALQLLGQEKCSAVLLGIGSAEDASGAEGLYTLRELYPHLPVVVLSSRRDESSEIVALALGAQDYLVKGQHDAHHIRRSIEHSIQRKKLETEFFHNATFDAQTRLPNALLMEEYLAQSLNRIRRQGTCLALMLLEIRNHRTIVRTFGMEEANGLLTNYASKLHQLLRDSDILARWNEDSFAILLEFAGEDSFCRQVANRIATTLEQPVTIAGGKVHVDINIGVALANPQTQHHGEIIIAAKGALFNARETEEGVFIYTPESALEAFAAQ